VEQRRLARYYPPEEPRVQVKTEAIKRVTEVMVRMTREQATDYCKGVVHIDLKGEIMSMIKAVEGKI
jgi:hypothetical protein